ncbi:MAG TPA: alpha-amylase family glycosyl hydrolase, partial [Chroococcales cyanobacterium]
PVVDNDDGQLGQTGLWGYHGYWAKDFEKVDEHLGNMSKLQELVAKAHQKSLKVLIDIVVNHGGYSYLSAHPERQGWVHQNGNIQNWDDPQELENKSIFGLPDFAQEKPEVSAYFSRTFGWWLDQSGADGYRIDTVKHVPFSFWPGFNRDMHAKNAFLLGEIYNGDPSFLARYQKDGGFDSVFDFAMYYTLCDVFAHDGSMRKLGDRLAQDSVYRDARLLSTFVDNHDLPRFINTAGGNESKLRLALAFIATIRGIPCLYQGTEWAMNGGNDPDNRKDLAWNSNPGMFNWTKKLLNLRRTSAALRRGEQLEMWQDEKLYAFARRTDAEEAIVVLNNASGEESRDIPLRPGSKIKDGTVLTDKLNGGTVTVQNGKISLRISGKSARVFL